jgi:hypothetical protein
VAGRAIPTLQSVLFGPLREQTFASEQVVDGDGLADRVGSISFVAAMEEAARAALLEEVRALTRSRCATSSSCGSPGGSRTWRPST